MGSERALRDVTRVLRGYYASAVGGAPAGSSVTSVTMGSSSDGSSSTRGPYSSRYAQCQSPGRDGRCLNLKLFLYFYFDLEGFYNRYNELAADTNLLARRWYRLDLVSNSGRLEIFRVFEVAY